MSETKDMHKSIADYRERIGTTYLPTLIGRADHLYRMNNWEEAGAAYETVLVHIYYHLGMVRKQLGDSAGARANFAKALVLAPRQPDLLEAVAELGATHDEIETDGRDESELAVSLDEAEILPDVPIETGTDDLDKQVEQAMAGLGSDPRRHECYEQLRAIYMQMHEFDRAWCACNALVYLDRAGPEATQHHAQYKLASFAKVRSPFYPAVWRNIHDPDEDRLISAIFSLVWHGAAALRAAPLKAFGLRRKHRLDVADDDRTFCKIFHYVANAIDVVPSPEVYLQEDSPTDIQFANVVWRKQFVPTVVVGRKLFHDRPEKEVLFLCARNLSMARPAHYLRVALPTMVELQVALLVAIVLIKPDFPIPPDLQPHVQAYYAAMHSHVAPRERELLATLVERLLQGNSDIDLVRWTHAVDATANRVGLILSGDLAVIDDVLRTESVAVGEPSADEKLARLLIYSVSQEYFAVREQLGLTIG